MPEPAMRLSVSVSLMFRELPIPDRFGAARQAGFDAVEIQLIDEAPLPVFREAATAAGIEVLLINLPMADFRTGGPALSGVPGREGLFREALLGTLDAASALGARFVHLGPSRVPPGVSREACLDCYRANLRFAQERAAGHPSRLVIEPLNRVETPDILIDTMDQAARLIDEVGGGPGIQFDLYHAAVDGHDHLALYRRHTDRIVHVQFADAPGRNEPGTGTVDFARIIGGLRASGYRGFLGAEYFPSRTTTDTFGWLPRFRELIGPGR